ncbi:hypothetical protein ACXIVK_28075 [Paraburkholderia caledonica]
MNSKMNGNLPEDRKVQEKRIMAVFQPQAWQNDYAVGIDGRTDVDVTAKVLALSLGEIHALSNDDYDTDDLVDLDALGHNGPFYVEVSNQVCEFFCVGDLSEVTEEMLSVARENLAASIARTGNLQQAFEYVIRSKSEGQDDLDGDVGAFWSNEDGWGDLNSATRFSTAERMSGTLPLSAKSDSKWMLVEEAHDLIRKLPEKRLWIALVEHESVPGTRPVLITQANEPSDAEIFSRFRDEADAAELAVVGVFDLSHLVSVDSSSREALAAYVRSASVDATVKQDVATARVPSVFDTMVPWGLNRSPIVTSM